MLVFDPGIAFDTQGWCYYSYGASVIGSKGEDYDNGLFVATSTDGGKTWPDNSVSVVAASQQGVQYQQFNDRYSIASDINPASKYKDYLYLTWRRFIQSEGICFSRSKDHNQNWDPIITLPGGNNQGTQSPIPIVGPNGEVYVIWQGSNNNNTDAVLQKSTDGGDTWLNAPKLVQSVKTIGTLNTQSNRNVLTTKASLRVTSLPYIAIDNSNGPRRGTIYVIQTGKEDNSNNTRVFLAKSTDGGNTWVNKIRIDNNPYGNDMFFPSISVDRTNGMVAVLYYSSQNDSTNVGFDAYCAISMDGQNFTNIRLTPQMIYVLNSSDVAGDGNGNNYWGDYTNITTYNGNVYPCWWMPAGYNTQFYDEDVFVALLSTVPDSPSNLKADNSYSNPTQVKLSWVDPVKNQLGVTLGDFKIVIYRNGTQIAQVNKGVQTYTDNGAVDGQPYTYGFKTLTSDNLESVVVTISGTAGGALQLLAPSNIIPRSNSTGFLLSWTNPNYHIDSSYAQDISKINIYKDSVLLQSVTTGITAGHASSVQITLPTEKFYILKLTAVGKRGSVETESNSSDVVVAYAGSPLKTLHENFDNPQTAVATYTDQGWGTTTIKAVSLPNSITDSPVGNYKNNANNSIYFPPLVMTSTDTTLCFEHIALIDQSNDWGVVSISKDFGSTWQANLGVNNTRSKGFTSDIATSQWFNEARDISNYKNDTIMIKFTLISNNFKSADGWYIDDLRVSNEVASVETQQDYQDGLIVNVYPNPAASDLVSIRVTIPFTGNTTISMYDMLGNLVKNVIDTRYEPGVYENSINISGLLDGFYYCRVSYNGITKTVPVIVNR
jgi:hypothetical protein